jgi:hypothetical protein
MRHVVKQKLAFTQKLYIPCKNGTSSAMTKRRQTIPDLMIITGAMLLGGLTKRLHLTAARRFRSAVSRPLYMLRLTQSVSHEYKNLAG